MPPRTSGLSFPHQCPRQTSTRPKGPGTMSRSGHLDVNHLRILSANLRGFQTNVGELTHNFVMPNSIDIVATVETSLNDSLPSNFGQIFGFSQWYRRDRIGITFGGIAVCFRKGLGIETLCISHPSHLELMFFRMWITQETSVLLCICYRPQWQGAEPIHFLRDNLDRILFEHFCQHIIILGDLNQYLVATAFDNLLTVFGMHNHVDFPTHISGSSLDPVLSDFPESLVQCSALGNVGTSDHTAILTNIQTALMFIFGFYAVSLVACFIKFLVKLKIVSLSHFKIYLSSTQWPRLAVINLHTAFPWIKNRSESKVEGAKVHHCVSFTASLPFPLSICQVAI
nr:uncharacterized protein LOC113802849 [Penaeus vannamei]